MFDLDETAWARGAADAKRWRGMLRWQLAALVLAILAGVFANWRGIPPFWAAGIGAGSGVLLLVLQVLAAVVSAPYRQRDEARATVRELQGDGRRFPTLREFHARGVRLRDATVEKATYPDWRARAVSWTQNTEQCLSVDYGPGEVELFEHPNRDHDAGRLAHAVNPEHDGALKLLDARLRLIQTILDRPD